MGKLQSSLSRLNANRLQQRIEHPRTQPKIVEWNRIKQILYLCIKPVLMHEKSLTAFGARVLDAISVCVPHWRSKTCQAFSRTWNEIKWISRISVEHFHHFKQQTTNIFYVVSSSVNYEIIVRNISIGTDWKCSTFSQTMQYLALDRITGERTRAREVAEFRQRGTALYNCILLIYYGY